MMKNKKMKKLGAALLSAALLLTPCISSVQAKENPYDDWKTTALQSPQKGKLVAAGDIDVKWNLLTSAKVKQYDVYFDGEFVETVDANTNETTVYTTKVSKHTVRVVAVLENKDEVNVSERTFYVSKKGLGFYNEENGASNSLSYAQNMGLSWYYNWGEQPFDEEGAANSDLEFVPMIYNDATDIASRLDSLKDAGYDKVLSFNEPDYVKEANMDYDRAASYNEIFYNSGLKVGSPAISGNAVEEDNWLEKYWNELETKDDFIAIHNYPGYIGLDGTDFTPKDAAKNFLDYIVNVHDKYQKPVWVTEFAVAAFESDAGWHPYDGDHENHNEAVQEFMDYVINGFDDVAGLDDLSFVERYAWFTFASTSYFGGSSALFPNKEDANKTRASINLGELTDLGEIYRNSGFPEGYTLPELDGSIDTSKIVEDKYIVDPQYNDSDKDLDDKKDNDIKGDDKNTVNDDKKDETDGKDNQNNNEQKPLQNVSNFTSNSSGESKNQEINNDQKQTDNKEKSSVKTGDPTSYVVLLLMMFTSLIGIFLLKNKNEY